MKQRILSNWTLIRALYLILGVAVIFQSIFSQQWFGLAFGSYFAAMGLFAFGCASGNCFGGACANDSQQKANTTVQHAKFEEVLIK